MSIITRREIVKAGAGLAAIIAAGKAPASLVRSMLGMHNAMMAGSKPTAKSYIQDGLVAMWDGIENAGWGTHDANATVWTDLTSNGYDAALTDCGIIENGVVFNGSTSFGACTKNLRIPDCTVEFTCTDPEQRNQVMLFAGGASPTFALSTSVGLTALSPCCYGFVVESASVEPRKAWGSGSIKQNVGIYFSNYNVESIHSEGEYVEARTVTGANLNYSGSNVALIGTRANNTTWSFKGTMNCLRVYSRALTADVIAHNYAIDKARFNLPTAT